VTGRLGLVLDIQGTQSVAYGERGIARFVTEHARALGRIDGLVRAYALNPLLPFPGHLPGELLTSDRLVWNTAEVLDKIGRGGAVAYHIMSPIEFDPPVETLVPPHAIRGDIPLVVTLYDLIPLANADHYLADPRLSRRYHRRLDILREADLVLAISEYTRRDAIERLQIDPRKIVSIGGGVSPYFRPATNRTSAWQRLQRVLPSIKQDFIFCVSGADDRKNTEGLITAYSQLPRVIRAQHQLVVSCQTPPEFERKWRGHAEFCGLAPDDLVVTGFVSDETLLALYQTAALFVFPSFSEGFGLPAAEAIACDCPVVTSSTTSLPEILEHPASTFDPGNSYSMAAAMHRILVDEQARAELVAIGRERRDVHTWSQVAARTVAALETIRRPPLTPSASRTRPKRLAIVGPTLPAPTGIATFNSRLIRELDGLVELDVYSSTDPAPTRPRDVSSARYFGADMLGSVMNPSSYDTIIYCFGNSEHHHKTYELVQKYPGIVWLHDVRLFGFYYGYTQSKYQGGFGRYCQDKLPAWYGDRTPTVDLSRLTVEQARRFGLGMTTELVRSARAVIVNSHVAERLLVMEQGPDASLPPLYRLFHAVPKFGPVDPRPASGRHVVGSFGIVDRIKAPDVIVEQLRQWRENIDCEVVFIGSVADDLRDELVALATAHGVEEYVTLTGEASVVDYEHWLRRVSCAVQLRRATNGESSGAVHDCIGMGVPIVTNMLGAAQEFPGGAVYAIEPDFTGEMLDTAVMTLLTDDAARARMAAAAREHAASHDYARLARRLLEVIGVVGVIEHGGSSYDVADQAARSRTGASAS
jgi:glycosyltransferase involved in cell wall biosynthesis